MPFFFTGCVHRSILPIRPSDFPLLFFARLRKIRRFSGKKNEYDRFAQSLVSAGEPGLPPRQACALKHFMLRNTKLFR